MWTFEKICTLKIKELRRSPAEPVEFWLRKVRIRDGCRTQIIWYLFNCLTDETTEFASEFDALMTAGYS